MQGQGLGICRDRAMPLHLSKEGVVRKGNAKALGAFSSNEGTKMYYNSNH